MNAVSALDFKGFTLTVSGNIDIRGATLEATNGATDIGLTIANSGGAGSNYFGSNYWLNNFSCGVCIVVLKKGRVFTAFFISAKWFNPVWEVMANLFSTYYPCWQFPMHLKK